ncbi:MAG: site-specific DNA-methyltransferase [Victivallaceae bacterium]|jgi:site-specific DNA-methyltransferase (adenine-specific)
MDGSFFKVIGISNTDMDIKSFAKKSGVSSACLKYFNENEIIPSGKQLDKILDTAKLSYPEFLLRYKKVNAEILDALCKHSREIYNIIKHDIAVNKEKCKKPEIALQTEYGQLYHGDCLNLLDNIPSESVDLVFADPPFNLDKIYPSGIDDNLKHKEYIDWCKAWLGECVRILKDGGSLFLWNLPKWNSYLASFLNERLSFRHWIAVDIKNGLPISGRLYPSHYSLLYYSKGDKPNTFHPDRLSMDTCPKCYGDLKDYGGYKDKMNPLGINITDVWYDIPPVRHQKYKRRKGANELSIKLLDRIIEMASNENDVVFDPFGGSGTTYIVSEIKKRKWIGIDIGGIDCIIERFNNVSIERELLNSMRQKFNCLFTEEVKRKRKQKDLWTCDSFAEKL